MVASLMDLLPRGTDSRPQRVEQQQHIRGRGRNCCIIYNPDYSFNVKYLGLLIDCHPSWRDHIEYTSSKISKNVNILTNVKKYLSKETLINRYYSFIYPYITYGSILWGINFYSPIYDVVKLQNKAIRAINDVLIMDNITLLYVNLGILKFPDVVKLHSCLFFFDIFNDFGPSNLILLLSEQHSYTTCNVSSKQLNKTN